MKKMSDEEYARRKSELLERLSPDSREGVEALLGLQEAILEKLDKDIEQLERLNKSTEG